MAILKSLALQAEDLQRENADACYDLLADWEPKLPINAPIRPLPDVALQTEVVKPFGYDYGKLPSRGEPRLKRWHCFK